MPDARTDPPPPPIVALAGWLIPGWGYWLLGERLRAQIVGITIVLIFTAGILISGIRVVEAPNLRGKGNPLSSVLQKPWFIGQVLAGPIGVISAGVSNAVASSAKYKEIEAKARLAEIGTLYTAVAGMLNLLAIIDSAYRAGEEKGQA